MKKQFEWQIFTLRKLFDGVNAKRLQIKSKNFRAQIIKDFQI